MLPLILAVLLHFVNTWVRVKPCKTGSHMLYHELRVGAWSVVLTYNRKHYGLHKRKKKSLTHFLCPHVLTRLYFENEGVMKKEKIGWVKWNLKWWHFPWGVAGNLYSLLAHRMKMESERKGVCCFSTISSYLPSLTTKLWFSVQY